MKQSNSNIKYLIGFGIVTAATLLIAYGASVWKKNSVITEIAVAGNKLLTKEEIIFLTAIKLPVNMYSKNLNELRLKLKQEPYIYNAVIQRDLPSRLVVKINEREPSAIISDAENKVCYIDNEGFVLSQRDFKSTLDLPVIFTSENISENTFNKSGKIQLPLRLLSLIKKCDTTFYKNISEVKMLNQNKLVIKTVEQGLPILLNDENIEYTVAKLSGFFNTYSEHLYQTKSGFIDARFSDQVIVSTNTLTFN